MSAWEYVGEVPTARAGSRHSLWRGRRTVGVGSGRWLEGAVMSAGQGGAEESWSQESQGSRATITLAQAHPKARSDGMEPSQPTGTSSRRPARRSSSPASTPPARHRLSITWGCRVCWQCVGNRRVGGGPPGSCGSTPVPSSPSSGSNGAPRKCDPQAPTALHRSVILRLRRPPPLPSGPAVCASTSSSGMSAT